MMKPNSALSSASQAPDSAEGSTAKKQRREPRSRFKPRAETGMRLEERDEQLLSDLLLHRAMSRGQLQTLYFTSLVRCNARLRQLFDHRFVTRYYSPIAPFGAQAIYLIGKAALPIVARRLEMDLPETTRMARCGHTPTFIEHTLATVDIYIAFRQGVEERNDVEMERWLPEVQCRHEWEIRPSAGGTWRTETFKPDGFVRLARKGGQYFNFFVETDLGHTSSKQFLGKLMTHQRYLESGLFRETYGGEGFTTLVVTTGERRMHNLRALLEEQGSSLFWLTTFTQLRDHDPLNAIWIAPTRDGLQSIL